MDQEHDELLTYRDVAALLGVRLGTIYSMVSRRQIPFVRVGRRLVRFSKRRVEQWLQGRAVEPTLGDER